jgi:tellurite resistance protein TehA-like permease
LTYRPIFFTAVMATGIVALALREEGLVAVSWVLAGAAAVVYVALALMHLVVWPRRPESRSEAVEWFALAAATEVLASLSRWHSVSLVLWAVGLAAWLVAVVLVLGAPAAPSDVVSGSWLLAAVATDSLAEAGAPIAGRLQSDALLAACLAWWLLALVIYCGLTWLILRRAWRRKLGVDDFQGAHWVLMGALAISTLAGSRMLAAMRILHWDAALRHPARVVSIAVWVGALCWLPALAAAESWRLRRRPLYTAGRWSTVFPLGMLAVASHTLALTAAVSAGAHVSDVFTAIAAAAWLAVAAGFLALAYDLRPMTHDP